MNTWIVRCGQCLIEMLRDIVEGKKVWKCPKCGYTIARKD